MNVFSLISFTFKFRITSDTYFFVFVYSQTIDIAGQVESERWYGNSLYKALLVRSLSKISTVKSAQRCDLK